MILDMLVLTKLEKIEEEFQLTEGQVRGKVRALQLKGILSRRR